MTARTRTTSATQRRTDNMRLLIVELGTREMLADDFCFFLKFSPSGARKYIRDLREAGVIELARYIEGTATYLGKAVYQITPVQLHIDAFLAEIAQPHRDAAPRRASTGSPHTAGPGRHFHIMGDDVRYAIRVSRVKIARDPIVAALFGTGTVGT